MLNEVGEIINEVEKFRDNMRTVDGLILRLTSCVEKTDAQIEVTNLLISKVDALDHAGSTLREEIMSASDGYAELAHNQARTITALVNAVTELRGEMDDKANAYADLARRQNSGIDNLGSALNDFKYMQWGENRDLGSAITGLSKEMVTAYGNVNSGMNAIEKSIHHSITKALQNETEKIVLLARESLTMSENLVEEIGRIESNMEKCSADNSRDRRLMFLAIGATLIVCMITLGVVVAQLPF